MLRMYTCEGCYELVVHDDGILQNKPYRFIQVGFCPHCREELGMYPMIKNMVGDWVDQEFSMLNASKERMEVVPQIAWH